MLAAIAFALFGLLSVHGWGSHASAHPTATPPQGANVMVASGASAPHDGGSGAPISSGDNVSDLQAASSGTHKPGGDAGTGLAALCLAVLGLLSAIVLLRVRGGIRFPRGLMPISPHPVFIGRDRDPPDLRELSVIRC